MVDRPKWSTLWSLLEPVIGIRRVGLIRAMRPGGDAPLEAVVLLVPGQGAVALQRKGVSVFHMA